MANNVKVLLKTNVESLGSGGEVVKVRAGFARNYLLPRGIAVPATAGNLADVERLKKLAATEAADQLAKAKDIEAKLGAVTVQIERSGSEDNRMWGSVTSKDIEEAFAKVGVTIDRKRLQLPDPIKTFGAHEVSIRLHSAVTALLKVEVTKKASAKAAAPAAS
jgi:large subunit ribosomal protein L9